MRALALLIALAAVPAAAQAVAPDRLQPLRPETQLELDRLARERLDLDAELQRQQAELNGLQSRRLQTELLVRRLAAEKARAAIAEGVPPIPPLAPADRARIAADTAADIGQIDAFLDGPK